MDPRKDFIHIDELFSKMQDGTDSMQVDTDTAWNKMRKQLDNEMPTGLINAQGKSRRRYFYPLLALFLASTSGTLGYWYFGNKNAQQDIIAHNTTSKPKSNINESITNSNKIQETIPQSSKSNIVSKSNTSKNNNTSVNSVALAIPTHVNNGAVSNKKNNKHQYSNSNIDNNTTSNTKIIEGIKQFAQVESSNVNAINASINTIVQPTPNIDHKSDLVASNSNFENKLNGHAITGPSNTQIEYAQLSNFTSNIKNEKLIVNTGINNEQHIAIAMVEKDNGDIFIKKEDGNWYQKIEKNTVINVVKEEKNNFTNNIEKTPIESINTNINELVLVTDPYALNLETATTSATLTEADKNIVFENLEKKKVGSKNRSSIQFISMIQKSSDDITRLFNNSPTFSAILNFGVNYTAIGNGSIGYQFGAGTMYYFGERLSLGAELKYVKIQFINYSFEDKSSLYQVEQNGNIYNGVETIQNNTYDFNSINRFQVPVYLNYYFTERLALIGGLQFSYTSPIRYQLQNYSNVNSQFASMQQPTNKNLEINPTNDFRANYGLGYIIGLGFDVNKKWGVDLRVSQNVLNSNNVGSDVINSFYRNPNVQLNMIFNIGKKEKIVFLMNN